MSKFHLGSTALVCAVLAACGGGGGGGSSNDYSTPVTLTTSNYQSVVSSSISGIQAMGSLSDFGSSMASALTGASTTSAPKWASFGLQQLARVSALLPTATDSLTGVIQQQNSNCTNGGTRTLSVNDANNNQQLDAGDSFSVTFSNCVEGTDTAQGSLSMVLTTRAINSTTNYSIDVAMTFGNLVIASGGLTSTANGSLRLVSSRTAADQGSDTISCSSFSASGSSGGVTQHGSLINFTESNSLTPSGNIVSFSGTVSSSDFGGSVTIATPVAFVVSTADTYPHTGTMVLTGSGNGKVTMTAINNTQISLALDANGDGTSETTNTLAWSAL